MAVPASSSNIIFIVLFSNYEAKLIKAVGNVHIKHSRYLVSWLRLSFFSNIPRRFKIIEKCFFVAVVTVLITAPSNRDGDEELRLLDMK